MRNLISYLCSFRRKEDGSATVEFAILFPFFVFMLCSSVELGMITFRHAMLERGLDLAVRQVRLKTGADFQHDDIKRMTCDYAGFLPSCATRLNLEMVAMDIRSFVAPSDTAYCSDVSLETNPLRTFVTGGANQLMLLRVCLVFDPIFPLTGLGRHLNWDGKGHAWMIATSAFVQEPDPGTAQRNSEGT